MLTYERRRGCTVYTGIQFKAKLRCSAAVAEADKITAVTDESWAKSDTVGGKDESQGETSRG